MDYKKNVMSTMTWTNEWLNGGNGKDVQNKEFLFLLEKKKSSIQKNFQIKRVSIGEPALTNQKTLELF